MKRGSSEEFSFGLPNRKWEPTGEMIKYVIPCSGGKVQELQMWFSRARERGR